MTIKPLLTAAYVATITFVAGRDPVSLARDAVEMELRRLSHMPDAVRTRHVGVYQQSSPSMVAICGQMSATGSENAFIDFAAVTIMQEPDPPRVQELHIADGPSGAARTRAESWLRCTDETRRIDMKAGAEMLPRPQFSPTAAPRIQGESEVMPAGLNVTMRQRGNLRSGPDASSPVIRTIPRGTAAHVFGEPQGGWYQIGDTSPWGWMHSSMLVGPPQ
jgi:hypothetical protein